MSTLRNGIKNAKISIRFKNSLKINSFVSENRNGKKVKYFGINSFINKVEYIS